MNERAEEGEVERRFHGIDGTAGDAQDVEHPFIASIHGDWCRLCGLSRTYRRHTGEMRGWQFTYLRALRLLGLYEPLERFVSWLAKRLNAWGRQP